MKLSMENLERRDVPASLSILDTAILEGHAGVSQMQFQVQLSEPSTSRVTVGVHTGATREASPGSDYKPTSATLTFAPGELVKTFSVPIYGDTVGETDERVIATLRGATGATIADGAGTGTIANDDDTHGASMTLVDGVLSIQGTDLRDGVTAVQLGNVLYVNYLARNADGSLAYQQTITLNVADVDRIEFHGGDGDDVFADYSSVFSAAFGEGGDDILHADEVHQD